MNSEPKYLNEDRISLHDLILRFKAFFLYLLGRWKIITLSTILIAGIYIFYHWLRKTNYTAETTFVIEDQRGGGGGQLSSLASVVGVNLDALGGADGLFSTDNIVALYRSRAMLYKTFLAIETIDGKREKLITRWIRNKKLQSKWQKAANDPNFTYEIADSLFSVKHDSLLFEVIEKFQEKNIMASKPDRKLIILSVQITDSDQLFAKRFNEVLVKNVNEFYTETRTKKNATNVAILQRQADSVKIVLDSSLAALAQTTENLPNPNPLFMSGKVPMQKLQIDVQSSALVYQEIVKNLELSKISLRNNKPLIQIIDRPMLPLENDKDRPVKMIVLGFFFGWLLTVIFFSLRYIIADLLEEEVHQQD